MRRPLDRGQDLTRLGQNWVGLLGAGLFSAPSLVFLGLFVLLAAGLYLPASTAWTAAERALPHRRIVAPAL